MIPTDLVPTGVLRTAILYTSAVLASRDATGKLSGIAVDLAHELGIRLNVAVRLVEYETTAALLTDHHAGAAWDVAFISYDPEHAEIGFTAPYLECDGTFLVAAQSPFRMLQDIDREGIRIAVSSSSSLDLHLSRNVRHARLMRAPGAIGAAQLFKSGEAGVLAGTRQQLLQVGASLPGFRILEDRFVVVRHAIAHASSRRAFASYLECFVEDAKRSGLVAQLILKHGIQGVSVAKSAPPS